MIYAEVIIFDFDGTLIPSNKYKKKLYELILKNSADTNSIREIVEKSYGLHSRKDIFDALCYKLGIKLDSEKFLARYKNKYISYSVETKPMIGFTSLFKYLKSSNFRICINTANNVDEMREIVDKKSWSPYFDLVLGSPNSKIDNFNIIMQELSCTKEDMCFVGDSQSDIEASNKSGIDFIAFKSPDSLMQLPTEYVVTSLLEIAGIVNKKH